VVRAWESDVKAHFWRTDWDNGVRGLIYGYNARYLGAS
jgi:hypothetical protein